MKKTMTSAFLALFLLLGVACAGAQPSGRTITIDNFRTDIAGDMLTVQFDVEASKLELTCGGQLTLAFTLEGADRRLELPSVVYAGKQRYRFERRRALLSTGFTPEPYAIYKGVRKGGTYRTAYRLRVPYSAWMGQASVTYREYTHSCSGDVQSGGGTLAARLASVPIPVYVEPEVAEATPVSGGAQAWKPDPSLYAGLVSFLVPRVEEVKSRASMLELRIGFPVNVTEVRPDFGNNRYELSRADSLVGMLQGNDLIDIRGVHIRGYASPEGAYAVNERLARGRSEGFKKYMTEKYPSNDYIRSARTSWVAEDWEGFGRMVAASDIPGKAEVLAIVNDPGVTPDAKDKMLQGIMWWSANYKVILKEMYPKLRRIELNVDYTVQKLSDAQARELLYTNPELLSLDEIYRVAKYYDAGSRQYREVYEIAARQYPDDVIANNNAAAALLQEGRTEAALPYLGKIEGADEGLINFGAYHYILGEPDKAAEYFNRAQAAGIGQGSENLRLLNSAR